MADIFNISSNYNFFESFAAWLETSFGAGVSEVKILLPNRRSCREFSEFLTKKYPHWSKMPKIKAIADISHHDFLDSFARLEVQSIVDEISKIKPLGSFDYLFFLSQEIVKTQVFGENISFSHALNIASQLKNLFDDIERQEIDMEKIHEIDDSDLAQHRQFTLDFLKKFYVRVKNSILKDNVFSKVAYQNLIINYFAATIDSQGLKSPLVVAGSTGSVNFSKKLIKSIAADKNGHVVLYGLNQEVERVEKEVHPQFILSELLKFIEVEKSAVVEIAEEKFKICDELRVDLLLTSMLPSEETHAWQRLEKNLKVTEDLEKNFSYVQAKNEIEEARIIAAAASQASLVNKRVAIIANDHKFVELLKAELRKFLVKYNDARSLNLSSSKLVGLILLLFELLENDFESATLLAVLKHPFSIYLDEKTLVDFEVKVLREQRSGDGLVALKEKIKFAQDEEMKNFFASFLENIEPLKNLYGNVELSKYFLAITQVIENFSAKTWQELIELEPAAEELGEFFKKLQNAGEFVVDVKESSRFFQSLFAQISYFEHSDSLASIQIMSTIEARLLNFDLMIVSSLNQGDFPQIEGENWLGRKIRSDLGIDLSAKKYGQNAYDFCNYLSNESVILTRCHVKGGALAIASPFILRLEILCKKLAIKLDDGKKYFDLLEKLDFVEASKIKVKAQELSPKPPLEYRPKKLSITEIPKLLSDPYQIYAKRILQLRELNRIDYEPEFREFGTFVHKALEDYIKNSQEEFFMQKAENIFAKFFISNEAKLIWWPKFENIFQNFIVENKGLQSSKDCVEVSIKMFVKDVLISGKIDRVSFFGDEVEIFDYKTGQIPSTKDVACGLQPQLTIYALMLILGSIENLKNISPEKIKSLSYWKLSATAESEVKKVFKDHEEIKIVIAAAKIGLEKLIEHFNDSNNGYASDLEPQRKHEYSHLARIF